MDLFESIRQRAELLADAARNIIISEQQSRRVGIPGYAEWNGFDSGGRATVKINNQVVTVFLNSNTCPPLGTKVYVDETFSVDYKVVYEAEEPRRDSPANSNATQRPKKTRKTILPVIPDEEDDVYGATWLVYHEYLKELDWTTTSGGAANPSMTGFDPLGGVPIGSISGYVLGSLLFNDLEFHFASYNFEMSDISSVDDHPNIPEGLSSDDFNYFAILAALLENLNYRNVYPTEPTDGLFLGPGSAVANALIFLGGSEGFSFTPKFFLRPWDSSVWQRMQGFLTHFGPGKVQWSVARAVGVYPPKQFRINFHAWRLPDEDLPAEYNSETQDSFPSAIYNTFVIPDDIQEWSQLVGNGLIREDNPALNQNEVVAYEVLPAHDFYDFEAGTEPDLTKFVSYSSNHLHLNYVIKTYAPWTGIDDSLRINYYALNLRAQFNVEDEENPLIVFDYNFNPSTFNLPPEMTFGGEIYVEDENFPIQAASGRFAAEPITYRFKGRQDPPVVPTNPDGTPQPLGFSITRGASAAVGVMFASDLDRSDTLTWSVSDAPPGFVYNSTNGKYIFEPNVAEYEVIASGQKFTLEFSYTVTDSAGNSTSNGFLIDITGNPNASSVPEPSPPPDSTPIPPFNMGDYDPAPDRSWDPDPFEEDETTGGPPQALGGVVQSVMLLPDTDSAGNILGWQGRRPQIVVEEVLATLRLNDHLAEDIPFAISDFGEFTVTESYGEDGKINGLLCTLDLNDLNLDWLTENDELQLTYTVTAKVNGAPYVGSFEDLNANQLRKIRSDFIEFAHDTDWRASIYNLRTNNTVANMLSKVEEDSTTRDDAYPYFNIDPVTGTISTDFVKEFYMHNLAGIREGDSETALDDQVVSLTNSLTYDFSDVEKELLFYWDGVVTITGYVIANGVMYITTAGTHPLSVDDQISSPALNAFFGSNGIKTILEIGAASVAVSVSAPDTSDFVSVDGYIQYRPTEVIPTVVEDVADVVRTGDQITIGNRWRSVLMPIEYSRGSGLASKLNFDQDLSEKTKGYLIFGFLGE